MVHEGAISIFLGPSPVNLCITADSGRILIASSTILDGKFIIYRFLCFLPLTIILCGYYYKKKNPVPVMIGHAIVEVASVVLVLVTSISPDIYQSWLNKYRVKKEFITLLEI